MIYKVKNDKVETFYVSFENKNCWKVKQTKNISVDELTNLLNE